jgi:hypothetical protein
MSFPPELLDELARVYARAAVDALLSAASDANGDCTQGTEGRSNEEEGARNEPDATE